MVTAGATANTTEGNGRASREFGLLCSHSHGESIGSLPPPLEFNLSADDDAPSASPLSSFVALQLGDSS